MLKGCFENNCCGEVTSICYCKEPNIYLCEEHIIKHMRSPGKHTLESLMIELDHSEKSEILPKLKEMIKSIQELKLITITSAKQLMDCIEKETKQALKKLIDLERNIAKLLCNKSISKENYAKILICNLDMSIVDKIDNVKKEIKELFSLNNSS